MEKISIKRKAGTITLSHKLSKHEHLNSIELDILQKGEIPMLCEVQIVSGVGGKKLLFQLPEYTALDQYLSAGDVCFGAFCETMLDLVQTIQNCDAHGIRSGNLELQSNLIFIEPDRRRLHILYWPLTTLSEACDARQAFMALGRQYAPGGKDLDWHTQYMELFNSRMKFNIIQFEMKLRALLESWNLQNRPLYRSTGQEAQPALLDKRTQQRILLRKFPFVFGRASELCDYSYPDDLMMSRSHFTLHEYESRIYLVDNGSTNGTIVNGNYLRSEDRVDVGTGSVEKSVLLFDGDVIQAGCETLICQFN